ncbi:BAG family molecular chaperone regulator 2 [Parasteatoda tepidariorum]|uniref:BAG family molecular chaperone regulator 2 n=1 Tax=Parasteatoda tepidariorum TaxID=114398 RepID=UPI00077FD095|nr:BAG family molecular chaperone regulator 2 [Parasteatoda tepidariorum]XP_015923481.1 BAG family molecular chaperone regulator 2 [Parasteatoda tepidariorum]
MSAHNLYVELLDDMELQVETLREKAASIESEREILIRNLGRLKVSPGLKRFTENEREEIEATAHRLMNRILTVEVNVITQRTEVQKKALTKVNKMVDDLLVSIRVDKTSSKKVVELYYNACFSESIGAIDYKFQKLVLDCAGDDQKRVRRRLQSIMDNAYNCSILMDVD